MEAVGRPTKALALVLLMLCSTQLIMLNSQSDATVKHNELEDEFEYEYEDEFDDI